MIIYLYLYFLPFCFSQQVIRLLLASGLTNEMVPNIIHMKDHLIKVNRHKETLPNPQPKQRPDHVRLFLFIFVNYFFLWFGGSLPAAVGYIVRGN